MSDGKDIAEIIADYRLHDRKNGLLKIEINRDHVERWIEQFPQNQDIILHKTKKLLSRYYFSEDNVYSFLELVAESEELWEDPEEAMGTAYFLDCQTEGKSQNHLLDMMEEVVLNTYDFDIKRTAVPIDGPATYIYLDDGLFSGRTLIRDMEALLPHIHSGSTVCAIFIIDYSFGDWWSHRRLNNTFQENGIKFMIIPYIKLNNSSGTDYSFDCLRPKQYESDLLDEYICLMNREKTENPDKKIFTFRNRLHPKSNVFGSEKGREVLEQELMEAGLKIYNLSQNRTQYMRPMGFDNRITFGFGAFFATFMNMSNNCPLAYWWGDAGAGDWHPFSKWYPLLPRRAHENVEPCAW